MSRDKLQKGNIDFLVNVIEECREVLGKVRLHNSRLRLNRIITKPCPKNVVKP